VADEDGNATNKGRKHAFTLKLVDDEHTMMSSSAAAVTTGQEPSKCHEYCGRDADNDDDHETILNNPEEAQWSTQVDEQDAIIVVDFINNWHWCPDALHRVHDMHAEMFDFLDHARTRGALVLHAVSDGKLHYLEEPDVLPYVRRAMQFGGGLDDGGETGHTAELVPPRHDTHTGETLPEAARHWGLVDRNTLRKLVPPPPLTLSLDEVCGESGKALFANKDTEGSPGRKPKWMKGLNTTRLVHPDIVAAEREAIYRVLKQKKPRRILFAGVHLELCILYSRWFSVLRMMKAWEFPSDTRFGILVPLVDISNTRPPQRRQPQHERDFHEIWRMACWIKCVAVPQVVGGHARAGRRKLDLIEWGVV
jgi:hypothetical protein